MKDTGEAGIIGHEIAKDGGVQQIVSAQPCLSGAPALQAAL
jgi:hypothetical protein